MYISTKRTFWWHGLNKNSSAESLKSMNSGLKFSATTPLFPVIKRHIIRRTTVKCGESLAKFEEIWNLSQI